MIFYIEINQRTYKVRHSIVIGRGTPFTDLASCDDIARTHAKIYTQNKKIYIEDLGSESGTFVNNLALEPHQAKEIKLNDNISIGKHKMTLMLEADDRSVKRVLNYVGASEPSLLIGLFSLAILFVLNSSYFGYRIYYPQMTFFLNVTFILLILVQVFKSNRFLKTFLIQSNDIVLGGDGLTFHYSSGESYSVKFSKIKKVFLNPKNIVFSAQGKVFKLNRHGHKLICETILKRNARFLTKIHPQMKLFGFFLLYLGVFIAATIMLNFSAYFMSFVFILGLFGMVSLLHFIQYLRGVYWFEFRGKMASRNNAIIFLVFLLIGSSLIDPYKLSHLGVIELVDKCLKSQNVKICEQIDYDDLYRRAGDKKSFQVLVHFACELRVKKACHFVNIHERMYE